MRKAERLRYVILAAQREGNRRLTADLAPLSLTPAQSEVLRVLGESNGITLTALGSQLICESGTNPSRLVDRLVEAGLVNRSTDAADRRQVTLTLTDSGLEKEARVREIEDSLYADLDAALGSTATGVVLEILQRLVSGQPSGTALNNRIAAQERSGG